MLSLAKNFSDLHHQLWTVLMLISLFSPALLSAVVLRHIDTQLPIQKVIDRVLVPLGAIVSMFGMGFQAVVLYSIHGSSVSTLGDRYIIGLVFGSVVSLLIAIRYISIGISD